MYNIEEYIVVHYIIVHEICDNFVVKLIGFVIGKFSIYYI